MKCARAAAIIVAGNLVSATGAVATPFISVPGVVVDDSRKEARILPKAWKAIHKQFGIRDPYVPLSPSEKAVVLAGVDEIHKPSTAGGTVDFTITSVGSDQMVDISGKRSDEISVADARALVAGCTADAPESLDDTGVNNSSAHYALVRWHCGKSNNAKIVWDAIAIVDDKISAMTFSEDTINASFDLGKYPEAKLPDMKNG